MRNSIKSRIDICTNQEFSSVMIISIESSQVLKFRSLVTISMELRQQYLLLLVCTFSFSLIVTHSLRLSLITIKVSLCFSYLKWLSWCCSLSPSLSLKDMQTGVTPRKLKRRHLKAMMNPRNRSSPMTRCLKGLLQIDP
jgi:hypothetical protein